MSLREMIAAARARAAAREAAAREAKQAEEARRLEGELSKLEVLLGEVFGSDVLERLGASMQLRNFVRSAEIGVAPAAVLVEQEATLAISLYRGELMISTLRRGTSFDDLVSIGTRAGLLRLDLQSRWDALLLGIDKVLEDGVADDLDDD